MHLVDALCEAKVALSMFEGRGYTCSRSGITLGQIFRSVTGCGHKGVLSEQRCVQCVVGWFERHVMRNLRANCERGTGWV